LINVTVAEKVRKAAAVVTKIMRAMRPLSAPKRSANNDTLLALGNAATNTITIQANGLMGTPHCTAVPATKKTNTGCSNNLIKATGK
jgi:hypothetical protein